MNSPGSRHRPEDRRRARHEPGRQAWLAAGAIVAGAALLGAAAINPQTAAAGYLVGFAFWSQVLVGSLSLVMIHRLTGGRWGEIIAPVMDPTSAAVALLLLLAVPLFIAIPVLYPWAQHQGAVKPDVLSYYLNRPFFIGRTVVALVGWTVFAWLLPRAGGWQGTILAAIGLVFHGLVISSIAIDWYLSLAAPFTSSSFGASIAFCCLAAALGWAALLAPVPETEPAIGDVGGLLLAVALGITYIDFMALLVIWYGDLPREVAWFVERDRLPWSVVALAAFILLSVVPILALMLSRVRNGRGPVRVVGGIVLAGLAVYDAYLILPPFGAAALITATLALIAMGLGLALVIAENPRAGLRGLADVR